MKKLRVLCTKKESRGDSDILITHIGGVNGAGEKWKISSQEAVSGMKSGLYEFYIVENFVELIVTFSEGVPHSLKANGSGYLHNLLEDLPDCP